MNKVIKKTKEEKSEKAGKVGKIAKTEKEIKATKATKVAKVAEGTEAAKETKKTEITKDAKKTSKFAIIETGGKQYGISVGDVISIERIVGQYKEKDQVVFDKVLLVEKDNNTTLGMPYIDGAKVNGEIVQIGRSKKILVVKYKQKSRYLRRKGHRQHFFKVRILEII